MVHPDGVVWVQTPNHAVAAVEIRRVAPAPGGLIHALPAEQRRVAGHGLHQSLQFLPLRLIFFRELDSGAKRDPRHHLVGMNPVHHLAQLIQGGGMRGLHQVEAALAQLAQAALREVAVAVDADWEEALSLDQERVVVTDGHGRYAFARRRHVLEAEDVANDASPRALRRERDVNLILARTGFREVEGDDRLFRDEKRLLAHGWHQRAVLEQACSKPEGTQILLPDVKTRPEHHLLAVVVRIKRQL